MKKSFLRIDRFLIRQREQDRRSMGVIFAPRPRSLRYRVVDAWNGLRHWIFGVGG